MSDSDPLKRERSPARREVVGLASVPMVPWEQVAPSLLTHTRAPFHVKEIKAAFLRRRKP